MRAILITPRLPRPDGKADSFTAYQLLKYLSTREWDVRLFSFSDPTRDNPAHVAALSDYCSKVTVVPRSPVRARLSLARAIVSRLPLQVLYYSDRRMRRLVEAEVGAEEVDIVVCQYLRTAEYARRLKVRKVLYLQPSQILNLSRMKEHTMLLRYKILYANEFRRVSWYEPSVATEFDRVFVISEHDRRAIDPQGLIPGMRCSPHGIDTEVPLPSVSIDARDDVILFAADMEVPTNIDAAMYFREEILPLIRRRVPHCRLLIVGRNPPVLVRRWSARDEQTDVTGWVEDLEPYMSQAVCGVSPMRIAAGMQNKILTYMSYGLPVVATTVANEGLGARVGEEILIADDPRAFADQVTRLLLDRSRAAQIGEAGRLFVRRGWSWERRFDDLLEELQVVVEGR